MEMGTWKALDTNRKSFLPEAHAYCFTLNNPSYQEWWSLNSLLTSENNNGIIYYGYGLENWDQFISPKPEHGQFHLQGVIVSSTKITLAKLKKISRRAHWETMNTTLPVCILYCSKEGKFVSMGDYTLAMLGLGKRRDYADYRLTTSVKQYSPRDVHAFMTLAMFGSNGGDIGLDMHPDYQRSQKICNQHFYCYLFENERS